LINALAYFDSTVLRESSISNIVLTTTNSSRKEGTKILIHFNILRRCRLGLFKEDFAVVGPSAVDVSTSNIPRLHEESSIIWRELFFHISLCPLQILPGHHIITLNYIVKKLHDHWLGTFVSSSWQLMTGNNVTG